MHNYRRILALVDFSTDGATVARRALRLARMERAELAFLHLIPPDTALDGGYPAPGPNALAEGYEKAALRRLTFLRATLEADGVHLLARYGHPAGGFADCISQWRPDLVVAADNPGYLGGRHDLLTLGRKRRPTGGIRQWLRRFMAPAGLMGSTG